MVIQVVLLNSIFVLYLAFKISSKHNKLRTFSVKYTHTVICYSRESIISNFLVVCRLVSGFSSAILHTLFAPARFSKGVPFS